MNINIRKFIDQDRLTLLQIWEDSVVATHTFLNTEEIAFYKNLVSEIDFHSFSVYCALLDSKKMVGFLGVSGSHLEMLFLDPEAIGKGVGYRLLQFAKEQLNIDHVDVNEANTRALAFYIKHGFEIYDRTDLDPQGKPNPILKMRLPG